MRFALIYFSIAGAILSSLSLENPSCSGLAVSNSIDFEKEENVEVAKRLIDNAKVNQKQLRITVENGAEHIPIFMKTFTENKVNKKSFLDCTDTIKRQVNNIQTLVSDFSNFARMPESIFKDVKLSKIIETQIKTIKILDSKIKFYYKNNFKELKINCDEIPN